MIKYSCNINFESPCSIYIHKLENRSQKYNRYIHAIILFFKYFVLLKTRIVVAYLRMYSEKLNTVQSSKTTATFSAYVFFSLPVEKRVEKNRRRRRGSEKWPFESVSVSRGKRRDRAAPRRSSIGRQTRLSDSVHTAPPRFLLSH